MGDTATEAGLFTNTLATTLDESAAATFQLTAEGAYAGGSFSLANLSLTESAVGSVTTA